ncbi:zinc knuckle CX2CX4HX4C containing protein [Tanacetum coccineum]|uniref:Zinc knuckle CX2CX4HX4C containing protein n=1 Tax=Tanacetum coccineum TaxID=301880 RepID=A0ABQ5A3E4_9ASTR
MSATVASKKVSVSGSTLEEVLTLLWLGSDTSNQVDWVLSTWGFFGMATGSDIAGDVASKIKNIDGKVVQEGKLRKAMRMINSTDAGTFTAPLDYSRMVDNMFCPNDDVEVTNVSTTEISGNANNVSKPSFAAMFKTKNPKVVRVTKMANEEVVVGANVAIPLAAVEDVSKRFENTLYGYFIGKRLAVPVVENYVKNAWAKFGLERTMLKNGFFFFQFATREGMERVLECGPWLIRLVPIILNVWTPNTRLKKDTITNAPIWVKIHEVPIVAYSEVGLSLISSQLGVPIMMDAYTSTMCQKSWGRASYARILIEVSSLVELKDSLVVAIPFPDGSGHSFEKVEVEYEWQPPRCGTCLIFYHKDDKCPKRVTEVVSSKEVPAHEAARRDLYRLRVRMEKTLILVKVDLLYIRNSFETLMDNDKVLDENLDMDVSTPFNTDPLNDDEEEVEEFYAEPDPRTLKTKVNDKGASTLVDMDDNV